MATHVNGVMHGGLDTATEIDLFAKLITKLDKKLRAGSRGENFSSSIMGKQAVFSWRGKIFVSICFIPGEGEKPDSIVIHPNKERRELYLFADEEVSFPQAMRLRVEIFLIYIIPLEKAYVVAVSQSVRSMETLVERVPRPAGHINVPGNGRFRHIPISYY